MHKKLALFPMTRDMCALARYRSLLQGFELAYLFTTHFVSDKDISQIDGGTVTELKLTEYNTNDLSVCDVLFVDYDENMKNLSLYIEVIQKAKNMGKEVMLSRKLINKLRKESLTWPMDTPHKIDSNVDNLYEIRVPVITVLSQGDRTDQLAIELALRGYFIDKGYSVSQVGTHEASRLMGFPSMPNFLFESRDAYDKTLKFNHYIKELTEKEQPDLLILGVPGAIMKYNNKLLNGLGYIPFVVCNAVRSDLQILSMYHNIYNTSYFNEVEQYGFYRLCAPIRLFNISNVGFIPNLSSEIPIEKYLDLNSEFVINSVQNDIDYGEYYLFNALDYESAKQACSAIEDILSNNVQNMK